MSTFPYCFRFNGSTYAQVGDASLNGWSAQTIAFWMWASGPSANISATRVLEKGANDEWTIVLNVLATDGKIFVQKLGNNVWALSSLASVCDATWHHIVVTIDNTGLIELFVDNVTQGTYQSSPPGSTSGALNIGQYGGGGYDFNGALNEIAVWNRVLSSGDRDTLWNSGNGVIGDTSTAPWNSGLEVLYHLDDGSGGTLADAGPHALDASIVGTPNWVSPGATVPLPIPIVYGSGNPFDTQLLLGVEL